LQFWIRLTTYLIFRIAAIILTYLLGKSYLPTDFLWLISHLKKKRWKSAWLIWQHFAKFWSVYKIACSIFFHPLPHTSQKWRKLAWTVQVFVRKVYLFNGTYLMFFENGVSSSLVMSNTIATSHMWLMVIQFVANLKVLKLKIAHFKSILKLFRTKFEERF